MIKNYNSNSLKPFQLKSCPKKNQDSTPLSNYFLWSFGLLVLMPIYLIHCFGLRYLCLSRSIWGDRTAFTIKISCGEEILMGGIWCVVPLLLPGIPELMSIVFFVILIVIIWRKVPTIFRHCRPLSTSDLSIVACYASLLESSGERLWLPHLWASSNVDLFSEEIRPIWNNGYSTFWFGIGFIHPYVICGFLQSWSPLRID